MVKALGATVLAVVVFGGTFALLAVLFRAQVRRFNRRAVADVLDGWAAFLAVLEPEERERAVPPADVLAAMAALPAPGWRSSWSDTPVTAFDRAPSHLGSAS